MSIEDYFETAELWREQDVIDAFDQTVKEWVKLKDIEGRMRQLNSSETYTSEKDFTVASQRFYTFEFDVRVSDKIKFDSNEYLVIKSNNVMNMDVFNQVDCELII
jgi:head-tail adaptor